MIEPLDPGEAKRAIVELLRSGRVRFTRHAEEELAKDDMTTVDAINVARGGVVEPAELENGTWRYRVRTEKMTVVVAFRDESRLVFITAWRNR